MTKQITRVFSLSQEELEDVLFNGKELEYTLPIKDTDIKLIIKLD